MAVIKDYYRADSLEESLKYLHSARGAVRVLAGGTDLLLKYRCFGENEISLMDISRLEPLNGGAVIEQGIRLGSVMKIHDLQESDLLHGAHQVLGSAASHMASPQIRNLATLGGNICNAAPSADTAGALLVLDAKVEIVSQRGSRVILLKDFFLGPGKTVLDPDEVVTSVLLPIESQDGIGIYLKHAPRKALECALAGVSVWCSSVEQPSAVRIALTAVAPTPCRAVEAEEFFAKKQDLSESGIQEIAQRTLRAAAPIDDVRASAGYRKEIIRSLVIKALRRIREVPSKREGSMQ